MERRFSPDLDWGGVSFDSNLSHLIFVKIVQATEQPKDGLTPMAQEVLHYATVNGASVRKHPLDAAEDEWLSRTIMRAFSILEERAQHALIAYRKTYLEK